MNTLNLTELVTGIPSRLRLATRYNTSLVCRTETVAEHCYYAVLYSMAVADWVNYSYPASRSVVNVEEVMRRAVLHDIEESITGDFPRTFKYSHPDLKNILDTASNMAVTSLIQKIGINERDKLRYIQCWKNAKDGTCEGRVIEFADFLSVLSYLSQERAMGNLGIQNHIEEIGKYFAKFSDAEYDFIRPLVEEVERLVVNLFPLVK